MKYRVTMNYLVEQTATLEISADSEEDAVSIADEIAPSQCEECSRSLETSEVEEIE